MSDIQTRIERRDRMIRDLSIQQVRMRTSTGDPDTPQRIVDLKNGIARADTEIAEMEKNEERRAEIDQLAARPEHTEAGAAFHEPTARRRGSGTNRSLGETRDAALRLVDDRSDVIDAPTGDELYKLIDRDHLGFDAEYVRAVGDPAYERAFARRLLTDTGAIAELEDDEREAMRKVAAVMEKRTALGISSGPIGGYAVPLTLDPTIMLTSDGSLNPWRDLATVTRISSSEWKGVASHGVTAAFANEGTEASDNSPTLGQPDIKPQRAQAFVPFSIEAGMDWSAIQTELGRLFADAKDVLEAAEFTHGPGIAPHPEGLLAGIDSASVIDTTGSGTFAIGDVYRLQNAIPPRWSQRATWISTNTVANVVYRFAGGGSTEPQPFNPDRTRLLGRAWTEVPDMDTGVTTAGDKILAYGDFKSAFRIVDRIGLTVELVAHLVGTNHRPTGQRGMFAYWRTSSAVVADNAARVLKIKA